MTLSQLADEEKYDGNWPQEQYLLRVRLMQRGSEEVLQPRREESKRQWLSGLAITLTALVCLFGFWRLSPGITFLIAAGALASLVAVFWWAGRDGR